MVVIAVGRRMPGTRSGAVAGTPQSSCVDVVKDLALATALQFVPVVSTMRHTGAFH